MDFFAQTTQPAIDAIDVLTKVDAFYDSAMTRLIVVMGCGIAIVGGLVPYVMQLLQARSFDKTEKKFREDLKEQRAALAKDLEQHSAAVAKDLQDQREALEGVIQASEAETRERIGKAVAAGTLASMVGTTAAIRQFADNTPAMLVLHLWTAFHACLAEDEEVTRVSLEAATSVASHVSPGEKKVKLAEKAIKNLEAVMKSAEWPAKFSGQLAGLRAAIAAQGS